ncbi:hypothetical protein BDB01DRAFT_707482, partial [Pilobolus umbonatus]
VKTKRFSFAGFSSSLSRSLSFTSNKSALNEQKVIPADKEQDRNKRTQKTKSLYIMSFKRPESKSSKEKRSFDISEAYQSNKKEVHSSIARSLSSVIYASPQGTKGEGTNKLVPVLVTSELSESVGGILLADAPVQAEIKPKKKKIVEYDNTLEIYSTNTTKHLIISWQGYGYKINIDKKREIYSGLLATTPEEEVVETLNSNYEKEIWEHYKGLIHPLHLFKERAEVEGKGKWAGLSVPELIQYYDNYGSMMLKIREARMKQQQ